MGFRKKDDKVPKITLDSFFEDKYGLISMGGPYYSKTLYFSNGIKDITSREVINTWDIDAVTILEILHRQRVLFFKAIREMEIGE